MYPTSCSIAELPKPRHKQSCCHNLYSYNSQFIKHQRPNILHIIVTKRNSEREGKLSSTVIYNNNDKAGARVSSLVSCTIFNKQTNSQLMVYTSEKEKCDILPTTVTVLSEQCSSLVSHANWLTIAINLRGRVCCCRRSRDYH